MVESRHRPLRFIVYFLFSAIGSFYCVPPVWAQTEVERSSAWADCGQAVDRDKQIVGCSEILRQADRESSTNRAIALHNRANAYSAKREYGRALEDYNMAVSLAPNSAPIRISRGNYYYARGQYPLALRDFEAALRLDRRNPNAHNGQSIALHALGQLERALPPIDEALRLSPDSALFLHNRGRLYIRAGDYASAERDLARAVSLGRGLAEADLRVAAERVAAQRAQDQQQAAANQTARPQQPRPQSAPGAGGEATASDPPAAVAPRPASTQSPASGTQTRGETLNMLALSVSGAQLHMGAQELLSAIEPNFPSSIPRIIRNCTDAPNNRQYICNITINMGPFVFEAQFAPRFFLPGLRPSNGQEVATYIKLSYANRVPPDVEREFLTLARQRYGEPVRRAFPRSQNGEWTWVYCNPCGQNPPPHTPFGVPILTVTPQLDFGSNDPPEILLQDPTYMDRVVEFHNQRRQEQQQQQQRQSRPPL